MQFKKYTKQRLGGIQGLRSFKDTLPTKVKKIINKKGSIFPEILNNWKYIVGKELFDICYPNRFKSSNKVRGSTLEIMDRMNAFFKDEVVKRIKFTSFNDENKIDNQKIIQNKPVTNNKYKNKLNDVKNEEIKNSLIELTKVFKEK